MYREATLFGAAPAEPDIAFTNLRRTRLDGTSWLDVAPGWLMGSDDLYDALATALPWRQKQVTMYGRRLPEPRLSTWWSCHSGPSPFAILDAMRTILSERYGVDFDTIGFNWYRHGDDSVAWHADTKGPPVTNPTIAIVAVGSRRPFRLRPKAGGRSVSIDHGAGDLLVMGGACQHDWQHTVPKSRHAGPRISITYRHSGNH